MRSTRILVIEDNGDAAEIMRASLTNAGYTVAIADSGQAALDVLADDGSFALIILDISLPDIDGFAVLDQLKNNDALRSIPVIGLSAHATSEYREQALASGCVDYLTKPASPRAVLKNVIKHIGKPQEPEATSLTI